MWPRAGLSEKPGLPLLLAALNFHSCYCLEIRSKHIFRCSEVRGSTGHVHGATVAEILLVLPFWVLGWGCVSSQAWRVPTQLRQRMPSSPPGSISASDRAQLRETSCGRPRRKTSQVWLFSDASQGPWGSAGHKAQTAPWMPVLPGPRIRRLP